MTNPRAKKPFATLAKDLQEIRKLPLSNEQVNELNRVFDEIEKSQKPGLADPNSEKKSARPPEAET